MEFIKVGKNYMIKNSNGQIVSEKEMLELQNNELIIKDFKSSECQAKTTQKIIKNKKRIEEIEKEDPLIIDYKISNKKPKYTKAKIKITATSNVEEADGTNKETNTTI